MRDLWSIDVPAVGIGAGIGHTYTAGDILRIFVDVYRYLYRHGNLQMSVNIDNTYTTVDILRIFKEIYRFLYRRGNSQTSVDIYKYLYRRGYFTDSCRYL